MTVASIRGQCTLVTAAEGAVDLVVEGRTLPLAKGGWIGEPTAVLANGSEVWVAGNTGPMRRPFVALVTSGRRQTIGLPPATTGVVGLGRRGGEVLVATSTRRGGAILVVAGASTKVVHRFSGEPVMFAASDAALAVVLRTARGRGHILTQSGSGWADEPFGPSLEARAMAVRGQRIAVGLDIQDASGAPTSVQVIESSDGGSSWRSREDVTWASVSGLALTDSGALFAAIARPDGPLQIVRETVDGWTPMRHVAPFESAVTLVGGRAGVWALGDHGTWINAATR